MIILLVGGKSLQKYRLHLTIYEQRVVDVARHQDVGIHRDLIWLDMRNKHTPKKT